MSLWAVAGFSSDSDLWSPRGLVYFFKQIPYICILHVLIIEELENGNRNSKSGVRKVSVECLWCPTHLHYTRFPWTHSMYKTRDESLNVILKMSLFMTRDWINLLCQFKKKKKIQYQCTMMHLWPYTDQWILFLLNPNLWNKAISVCFPFMANITLNPFDLLVTFPTAIY